MFITLCPTHKWNETRDYFPRVTDLFLVETLHNHCQLVHQSPRRCHQSIAQLVQSPVSLGSQYLADYVEQKPFVLNY
jgi:hypothetical protein